MRKLYPQALRAEHSIQELRSSLLEAQAEGQGQRRQLLETDRQIRDLHGRLGIVEKQQREISHELDMMTLETEESFQQTRSATEEAARREEDIVAVAGDRHRGVAMLEEAAQLARREREMTGFVLDDVIVRRQQLADVSGINEELSARLAKTCVENRGFSEELAAAARLAELQAEQIDNACRLRSDQHLRCEWAETDGESLGLELAEVRQEARRARTDLIRAEDLAAENAVMRESLDPRKMLREELSARMLNAREDSAEAEHELANVEAATEELGRRIATSEDAIQESRWKLDQVEDEHRTSDSQLSSWRREMVQLEQILRAESRRRSSECNVWQRLKTMEDREAAFISEKAELHQETIALKLEKDDVIEESERLEAHLTHLEMDTTRIRARKTECLQHAAELQRKPMCLLS